MATDLFDPSEINAAVGNAFGVKTTTQAPAPQTTGAVTDELLDRLKKVESGGDVYALNKKTKAMGPYQFMPETVQMLHRQGIKFNPFDEQEAREAARTYLTNLTQRHNGDIDLALKDYGGFVTKNPARYVEAVSGNSSQVQQTPQLQKQQKEIQPNPGADDDLMNPGAINEAVSQAFGEEPKLKGVSGSVKKFLRSSAALADTVAGVVPGIAGMATYAGARAVGQTPEEASIAQAKVVGALDKPIGKAFGITETPEYKGEASQQLIRFIGENVEKGADWISKQTGVPKSDVEFYINSAALAPAGLRGTKVGQAIADEASMIAQTSKQAGRQVLEAAKDVTPQSLQKGIGQTVEAIAPGTTKMPPKAPSLGIPEQSTATIVPPPPGRASVGAAATPDATIIRQALETATPEFQQLYGTMPLDKVNTPVVLRHLEADSLPIPIRLTKGQSTGDVVQLSKEQNLRGSQPEFANRFNEQNQQLVDNVPLIRERAAPDVYATKTIESSQAIIDAYKNLDSIKNKEISSAYKALEDAAGGNFPVDGVQLAKNAEAALGKKLKTDFLASPIKNQLEKFKSGEPMTFEQFEAMRTNLAAEIRKAERTGDGNAAMAASIVRDAMENLPLKQKSQNLKKLADNARSLAKARFDELKKDPAYKAAVDDIVPADKFFDKFVINGVNKNIETMVNTLGRESPAHQHMKAGTINWLSDKAGIVDGRGNFSQANYNKALKRLDDVNNFKQIFDPQSQLQLRTLGNVAAYTQFQPRGSFVNNSNTLVGYLANKAAGGLEQAGNVMGLKTLGYPLGSEARRIMRSARERREAAEALRPGAGSTLNEIVKKGR